jgi:hypothetical protein
MNEAEILEPTAATLPPGEYCILELFGHTTLVGRFSEVERFGTKMCAIEPLFKGTLLPVVFHGGAAIYRLTPCSAKVAWERQPQSDYQLPPSIRCIVPTPLLAGPVPSVAEEDPDFREVEEVDGDGNPVDEEEIF